MDLCKYSKLFGDPKKGIHSYRIFDIAIADVIQTIIGAIIFYYISKFLKWNINFYYILASLFIIGIISHKLFCVDTTINRLIFG